MGQVGDLRWAKRVRSRMPNAHARLASSLSLALALALAAAPGCGRLQTYVKTDDAALGRVIVYRNGVAYYERRARIEADALTLHVPGDKLDDFLKSLTVADAATGKALPLSYPSLPENVAPGPLDITVR